MAPSAPHATTDRIAAEAARPGHPDRLAHAAHPGAPAGGARTAACEYCGDTVGNGGSFCSDAHAAAWLESPFA